TRGRVKVSPGPPRVVGCKSQVRWSCLGRPADLSVHIVIKLLLTKYFNSSPFGSFFLWHIIEKGEENCGHLIEAHKECMRALGFKI
uniref:Uncharacterized protein n=1 Tax=Bubo bubo TaxID=30461 RepID=A0A8C0EYQ5_BUBBB